MTIGQESLNSNQFLSNNNEMEEIEKIFLGLAEITCPECGEMFILPTDKKFLCHCPCGCTFFSN